MFNTQFIKSGVFLEKAQTLRHRVFFENSGKDEDTFDEFCKHLIVIEKDTKKVVGTYRLLLASVAKKHAGFYSETQFNLSNIKKHCRGELLELGRSCVDPDYRKYPILALMWKEIIRLIDKKDVRYVFGCASVDKPTPQKIGKIFSYFKNNYFSPSLFRTHPLEDKIYPYDAGIKNIKDQEVRYTLPTLIKGYLKMGATICSEPAWDRDFDTADFFMLLRTSKINRAFKKKFL